MGNKRTVASIRRVYRQATKSDVPCALCGSSESFTAVHGDQHGLGLHTVVCKSCGLIFTSPRPSAEWFDQFYRIHYRHFNNDCDVPDDQYLNRPWIKQRLQNYIEILRPYLSQTGKILDIGCGEGTFLYLFKKEYPDWEVYGISPDEGFADYARTQYGLKNVVTGGIDDLADWAEKQFDLITANHVLEHLFEPNKLFSSARHLLKDDGLLFIDVPDAEGQIRGIVNLHIEHLYHFSQATMRDFLDKNGFRTLLMATDDGMRPWTFHVVAAKSPELLLAWRPRPVNSKSIAEAFAQHCRLPIRTHLYRLYVKRIKHFVPKALSEKLRAVIRV